MANARIVRPYDQLPAAAQRYRLWLLGHPKCGPEGEDYLPDEFAAMAARRARDPQPLGAIPLIVVPQAKLGSPPPGVSAEASRQEYADRMAELARLSQRGRVITDTLSGHHVHLDNPRLVVGAIRDVVREVPQRRE